MVWTDRTNGAGGQVHVRTLATGDEHSFDPHAGARCNLLSMSATQDRVVLSEYCGEDAVHGRDDRVQILTTEGDQVVTIQDSGIGGWSPSVNGDNDVVAIDVYEGDAVGTYAYDLRTGHFFRISHGMSKFSMGGPGPSGDLMWSTPVNGRHGATQWVGQVLP
jgi:hypothetical protein